MTEKVKTKIISILIFMCLIFNLFPIGTMVNYVFSFDITFKTVGTSGFYTYDPFNFCESMSNKITESEKESVKQEKQNKQDSAGNTNHFAIINTNNTHQRSGLSLTNVSAGSLPLLYLANDFKETWVPSFMGMAGLALFLFFLLMYLSILFRKDRLTVQSLQLFSKRSLET
jgi:hypothetical protein